MLLKDAKLAKLDNMDEDDLDKLRERRKAQLIAAQKIKQVLRVIYDTQRAVGCAPSSASREHSCEIELYRNRTGGSAFFFFFLVCYPVDD